MGIGGFRRALGVAQFLFRALPLGDVTDDNAIAMRGFKPANGHEQRQEAAGCLAADHFAAIIQHARDTVIGKAGKIVQHGALALMGKEGDERFAGDFAIIIIEQRAGGTVERADFAFVSQKHHAIGGGFQNGVQFLHFALQEGEAACFRIFDVAGRYVFVGGRNRRLLFLKRHQRQHQRLGFFPADGL
ncbi:hypothetical protein D3C80_1344760 [compost metagenome]